MRTLEGAQPRGRVVGLFSAPAAGAPMRRHRHVDVLPNTGIAGDRYALGLGHWSDPRWPDQELTLVMAEVAERLAVAPATLRRNVVTRDVDLEALIGVTFQLGDALLLGVRRCDPCRYVEQFTRPGLARALGGQGGLRAHVLIGGRLRVGDRLVAVGAPAAGRAASTGDRRGPATA